MVGIILVAFLALSHQWDNDFPYRVAARCKGEASYAIRDCACTVRNRLDAGWAEHRVLDAYFAMDVEPTRQEVDRVRAVLILGCKEDYYFMYSREDVYNLGISHVVPLQRLFGETGEVWFYEQSYRNRIP